MLVYLISLKPFKTYALNFLNIHNEVYMLLTTVSFIMFTDAFDLDDEFREQLGFIPMGLSMMFLGTNISYMMYL